MSTGHRQIFTAIGFVTLGALATSAGACSSADADAPGPALGAARSAIVGGDIDTTRRSVVLVGAAKVGEGERHCTGVVVSPHVVLTAAHCVSEITVGAGYRYYAWMGDDPSQVRDQSLIVWAKETHLHPEYDESGNFRIAAPRHDLGVLVTKAALGRTPLALRRTPLPETLVGQTVRFVGFGLTATGTGAKDGTRKSYDAPVVELTSDHVVTGKGTAGGHGCVGDSGGPLLLRDEAFDRDVVVGINSWSVDATCAVDVTASRVDVDVDGFLAPIIERVDPGFLESAADPAEGTGESEPAAGDEPLPEATTPRAADAPSGCATSPARPAPIAGLGALVFALGSAFARRRRSRR